MTVTGGRFLFVCGALLVFANVALGQGIYQSTRDGKTLVWNNHPKSGDEATWSGRRDRNGYARGFGTLIWYTSETGAAKPALYARKLNGPVNVHSRRKTSHAIFVDGERRTRWAIGPASSRTGAQWRAVVQRTEIRKRPMDEAEPEPPAEGPMGRRPAASPPPVRPSADTATSSLGEEGGDQRSENTGQGSESADPSTLTRDLPIAQSPHQATHAVHPTASRHVVFNAQPSQSDVDDPLRVLAWPPPALGRRSVSRRSLDGASMRAKARLTREQVVDLCNAAARSRGYDPADYERQDPQYDPSAQAWLLTYDERLSARTGETGKHLSIAVADKTKRTALVPGGKGRSKK